MKFLMFLATKKGYETLKRLVIFKESIGAVISFKEVNVTVAYHDSIEKVCIDNGIPFFYWNQIKDNLQWLIGRYEITGAITISWKYLLDLEYFNQLKHKLIVFHDSLLPKYRGFAPTPTAVICGESEVGITAIFACNEVDAGDIILQKKMEINQDEYISDIIDRQAHLYSDMVLDIFQNIDALALNIRKQDSSETTYSIWRSPEDCHIDWNNSSLRIYNMIRAVGKPYLGAFTYMENDKITINKAVIAPDMKFAIRDSGKIWRIDDNCPTVVCGEGLLKIIEATYEDGKFVEFKKLRVRLA